MLGSRSFERAGPSGEDTSRFPSSYYAATTRHAIVAPALHNDAIADFCVIGGGFTGLGAALALARAGHSVRLIEAGTIGWGASGRNGGQVHIGWQQDLTWLTAKLGNATAEAMWQAALAARAHLDTLIALDDDACDFRTGLIHADHKPHQFARTHAHVAMMRDVWHHDSVIALDREELRTILASPAYYGGSLDSQGGHLNPLKLAFAMARAAQKAGAMLHMHTPCIALSPAADGWTITTPDGNITAGKVLDATGAYARALVPETDRHVLPINNYIATTVPLGRAQARSLIRNLAAVSDARFVTYYFRVTPDHRLLFGGGETYGYRMPRDIGAFVRPHMLRVFPQLRDIAIEHAWGGTLAISPNRLPFIIEPAQGLYAANGLSGLGVVLAPWLGDAVGRAMAGDNNAGYDLISRLPAPRFPGGRALRWPTQALAMRFMALRDRF